jgi:hypothetical protein
MEGSLWQRFVAWVSAHKILVRALGTGVLGTCLLIAAFAYIFALKNSALPLPPGSDGSVEAAQKYCSSLTLNSSKMAVAHFVCGWTITVMVVITAAVALVKVTLADNRLIWIACIGAGAYLAKAVLARADAATELAVATTTAQTLDHTDNDPTGASSGRVMYNTCAQAWAAWLKSRTDSTAIARAALEESIRGVKQANESVTSNAQVQATQAKQAVQTVSGVATKTKEDIAQQTTQLDSFADKLPANQREQVKALSNQIKSTVATAAEIARSATAEIGGYVVLVGTDTSLKEACEEAALRSKDNLSVKLFSNGTRTKWMTVLGPVPTHEEADTLKSRAKNLRSDSYVTPLAPEWIPASCGPGK